MNSNEKSERDKKMKVDKRTKDYKRMHANKIAGRPVTGSAGVRNQSNDLKGNTAEKSLLQSTQALGNVDLDTAQSSQLKRETDAISDGHKTYSKRQLVSNWSKYETALPSGDAAYNVSNAADFGSLLHMPMSEGGHFQFKSERIWEEHSPSQYSDIFSIDLKKLSASLSCVPFYDQLNLSKELFSEDELKQMDREAKQNREQYDKLLKESATIQDRSTDDVNVASVGDNKHVKSSHPSDHLQNSQLLDNFCGARQQSQATDPNVVLSTILPRKPGTSSVVLNQSKSVSKPPLLETDDELDFLLTLKEPLSDVNLPVEAKVNTSETLTKFNDLADDLDAVCLSNPTNNSEKKEDLEDWLDSMLDD